MCDRIILLTYKKVAFIFQQDVKTTAGAVQNLNDESKKTKVGTYVVKCLEKRETFGMNFFVRNNFIHQAQKRVDFVSSLW